MFECAVVLLGSADMSWRAVRHATQDESFCTRLAAVCVPALTQTVISTIADKLEVMPFTVIHKVAGVTELEKGNLKDQFGSNFESLAKERKLFDSIKRFLE